MERLSQNESGKELPPVTVSEEIRSAYVKAEARGLCHFGRPVLAQDVQEYIGLKTEVRDILSRVGLWTAEVDQQLDRNLIELGGLGISLESIGKWMERTPSKERDEALESYRENARRRLHRFGLFTQQWEAWLQNGSPEDLKEIGDPLSYMSRAGGLVQASRFSVEGGVV